ncbi:MAG: ribonuclease III [Clostridia bacterium]|jgi:ribonuclease-3|nr:ribonuclease III [Clostridia bacterium]
MELDENRLEKLAALLQELKIESVSDFTHINQALVHSSYLYEGNTAQSEHNQRLEFLGDAVVGLIIAHHLFETFPKKPEGELTKMRAAIVCEAALAEAARRIGLGEYLLMGKGEEQMGGKNRLSNLADCFEAFVGALYLTIDPEKTKGFVLDILQNKISASANGMYNDFKTHLQEFVQKKPDNRVTYRIIKEEGPDHAKVFYAAVFLNEREVAQGKGSTKKEAEQRAAKKALKEFGELR